PEDEVGLVRSYRQRGGEPETEQQRRSQREPQPLPGSERFQRERASSVRPEITSKAYTAFTTAFAGTAACRRLPSQAPASIAGSSRSAVASSPSCVNSPAAPNSSKRTSDDSMIIAALVARSASLSTMRPAL